MFTSVSTAHFELAVDQPFPVFPHPELQTLLVLQEHAVIGVHLEKKRVKFSKNQSLVYRSQTEQSNQINLCKITILLTRKV
jgi:hypothetical protein